MNFIPFYFRILKEALYQILWSCLPISQDQPKL